MSQEREPLFAFRKRYTGAGPFGNDGKEIVEMGVVEAETPSEARAKIISRCSVLSLDYGVTLEIAPLGFDNCYRFLAKYDGPPMDDYNRPTSAKLQVTALAADFKSVDP
jgi:hypothetical protein